MWPPSRGHFIVVVNTHIPQLFYYYYFQMYWHQTLCLQVLEQKHTFEFQPIVLIVHLTKEPVPV